MAVTTESTLMLKIEEATVAGPYPGFDKDKLRVGAVPFDFTQGVAAGDATSMQRLRKMPPGKHFVIGIVLARSAFGATRVLDIGYEAHTKSDGTTAVAVSADAFQVDLDVAAAGISFIPINAAMDSLSGYVVFATVGTSTIPAAATPKGSILYAY